MPREIDEDLIEATIRRVAESAAAASGGPSPADDDDGSPPPDVLRDASERAEAADEHGELGEGDEVKALERLRFDDHESFGSAGGPRRFSASTPGGLAPSPWAPVATTDDASNDDIDEAGTSAPPAEPAPAGVDRPAYAEEDETIAPASTGLGWPKAMPVSGPSTRWEQAPSPEASAPPEPVPAFAPPPPISAPHWEASAAPSPDSPATLAGIAAALEEINGRLDTMTALIERLSGAASVRTWDAPDPRITALPPRQEPITRGAVAAQLQPDRIDTRPLPQPLPPLHVEPKRGLELLPRTYRITVEDKRQGVDLVPLHRALLGMDGVKDMSLLSYNNGVAIVALETNGDIDPDLLRAAVSRAMQREAQVEVHNEHTMVVKLAED